MLSKRGTKYIGKGNSNKRGIVTFMILIIAPDVKDHAGCGGSALVPFRGYPW